MKQGDKSFKERDYYGASLYYKKAMIIDSTNLMVVNKYAESLRSYNEYELAEIYYQYIYKKDNGRNYREALFYFASMQKYNGKYQDARKNFNKFSTSYKDKQSYFFKKAIQEIGSCEFAQNLMQDTLPLSVLNMGPLINSTNAEFSTLALQDSLLLFSSLRSEKIQEVTKEIKDNDYHIKIYTAKKSDSGWVMQKVVKPLVYSTKFHDANGTFSRDGNKFYFTRCDEDFKCNIYISDLKNGFWGEPYVAESDINAVGYTTTQPFIATINETEILFFSSDRPGTEGSLDIWYTTLQNGKATQIYNAGKNINTLDEELSPFYDNKEKVFYFSSAWHFGLGGYDIFKSAGLPGFFQKPQNLGYPINTSTNDFYYTSNETSGTVFLTSNRKGSITSKGETCCNDIWYFNKDKIIKGDSAKNEIATEKFIPVRLYFHNDEPNPRTLDTITAINYFDGYTKYLKLRDIYKKEYASGFDVAGKENAGKKVELFFTYQVEKGGQNLEKFTEQLLSHLEKGQRLEVTVKGFASPLAKTEYNINLTLRRISSMENYMKSYKNGALLPYFTETASNGGKLNIIKIPFGEYKAAGHVNDKFNELNHSIYSPDAALERKIEVVSVKYTSSDTAKAEISFKKEIFNFGSVKNNDTLSHTFVFRNIGKSDLIVSQVSDSCDCILTSWNQINIPPGQTGKIDLTFVASGKIGKSIHHIIVESNAKQVMKELTITAEIKN